MNSEKDSTAFTGALDPLPPPYYGTISFEDGSPEVAIKAGGSETYGSVTVTRIPIRGGLARESLCSPPAESRAFKRLSSTGAVPETDVALASTGCTDQSLWTCQSMWLMSRNMRRLTTQIHKFVNTQAFTNGLADLPEDEEQERTAFEEEKKTADPEIPRFRALEKDAHVSSKSSSANIADSWSSLENAVRMLMEHCRLAQNEAEVSQQAQVQANFYRERALAAEAQHLQLENDLVSFKRRTTKLSRERKVLVQEVKMLRQRLEHTEQKDVWRQVENYVVRALSLHESQLSKGATITTVNSDLQQQHSLSSASPLFNSGIEDDVSSSSMRSIHSCEGEMEGILLGQRKDATPYIVVDSDQSTTAVQEIKLGEKVEGLPSPCSTGDDASDKEGSPSAAQPVPALVAAAVTSSPATGASTPVVRASLGFGGHVALGFGRSYGKAMSVMKPKIGQSASKSAEKRAEEKAAAVKPQQVNASETLPPLAAHTMTCFDEPKSSTQIESSVHDQSPHPLSGYRSRVNSGEMFGSTVKKFLQTGSNSIVGAISTATGRTSPLISLSDDTLETPRTHSERDAGNNRALRGLKNGAHTVGDISPAPSVTSVPGDILANYSKDVSYLGSPVLLTPSMESPSASASSSLMMIELDCDPRILRSLSLPFVVPRDHDPHVGKQVHPSGDEALDSIIGASISPEV
jgi:hypothetical protein